MVSSQFGAILKEFETFFKCTLEPDSNDSCQIKMGIGITIQIELDSYGFLLIGCRLGALPMSRYRDNLIHEALKSNEAFRPFTGTFGFSRKSNQLILFLKLNPDNLSHTQILALMPPFVERAKYWTNAMAQNEIPVVHSTNKTGSPSGLFGLISK